MEPAFQLLTGSTSGLRIVDRSAALLRKHSKPLLALSLPSSAVIALVVVGLYYFERVQGIASIRPVFAVLLALLLTMRSRAAGAVAVFVHRLALGQTVSAAAAREAAKGRAVALGTSGVLAAMLDLPALLLFAWVLRSGASGAALILPIAGLRWIGSGPTLVPRVAVTQDGVARAYWKAWGDGVGARARWFTIEMLLCCVPGLLFANGAILMIGLTSLLGSLTGIDLAFAESFLSTDNGFAMVALVVTAALATEPLRMTASALAYVDALIRRDALDLRLRVDAVTLAAAPCSRGRAASAAALLLVAVGLMLPTPAAAQDSPSDPVPAQTTQSVSRNPGPSPAVEAAPDARRADDEYRGLFGGGATPQTGLDRPPGDDPWKSPTGDGRDSRSRSRFLPPGYVPNRIPVAALPEPRASLGARAREHAERILARREYQSAPEPGKGRLGEWLRDLVRRLFESLSPPELNPDLPDIFALPGMQVFLVLGGLVLAGGIAYAASVLWLARSPRPAREKQPGAQAKEDPRERDPMDILDDAERLRREGNLREALRVVYLATLVQLDRLRLISFDPALTNWQYLRFLPKGAQHDLFAELTHRFDYKWYGHEPVTDLEYEQAREQARRILSFGGAGDEAA